MPLDLHTLLTLATACAPSVAPQTLLAVARVESGLNPLAIGVNGPDRIAVRATNREDATTRATALIAAGRNVDLGLSQINSRNLRRLGLSVSAAFDSCESLRASARVLQDGYVRAAPSPGQEQAGLRTALSFYNTGHPTRGLRNGYVAKVVAAARGLQVIATDAQAPVIGADAPPAWDVFGRARARPAPQTFVISPSLGVQP